MRATTRPRTSLSFFSRFRFCFLERKPKKSFCGILGLRMCRASLFLWVEKRSPRKKSCLENPGVFPFRSTLRHRHARRRSGQSERRRSSDVAVAHTSASPTVAHARSTPTASEPGSRRPTSPGPSGRVVGTEAARASFKSPPRDVAERPWRFRGITCSGCSRARQAWAAGRSAADSSP